jgi:PEP-CTERM motif
MTIHTFFTPLCLLGTGIAGLLLASPASAQLIGPTPYLAFDNTLPGAGSAISPFASLSFTSYFHRETFEDGLLNTPGVSALVGGVVGPGGSADSVDADDGTIDGLGTTGRSFFSIDGATGLSFTFNAGTLGGLPTHAGLVWTDGAGTISFQAFDADNILLGSLSGSHADPTFFGNTDEDRFYGVIAPGGISRIAIQNASGGIEIDHLQYGRTSSAAAPEPGTLALMALGVVGMIVRKKRK